ncbi:MAG: alpha/beta hydrolase, partial [Cyclobacteriaceae bacterium]
SAPRFAATLSIPGLIIHDEADDEAPYHHALRIHKAWPQSKLITTKGFGHNLRVPEVVEMVKGFVEERAVVQI